MGARQSNNLCSQAAVRNNPCRPLRKLPPRRVEKLAPPPAAPISPVKTVSGPAPNPAPDNPNGAGSSFTTWQGERVNRLARIFRCIDRGRANGKRLHEMLVWFTWRWKGRRYKCDPARRIRFARGTLGHLYRRWKASGGNPAALALRYRAPVKIRPGLAFDFARLCIDSDVRTFTEAHGRIPRPVATFYAYRLALSASLRRRIVGLFAARRLVAVRTRKARAAANRFARRAAR